MLTPLAAHTAPGFHLSHLLQLLAADPGGAAAHAAGVAANVSSTPLGRRLVAAPGEGRVPLLVRVLGAPAAAAVARRGAAAALRNCALDADTHGALLGDDAGALVTALLAPLAPAARAAEDAGVREACADALAALAGSDAGRAAMWAGGAVEALRSAYEDEEVPGVCAAMEHAVRACAVTRMRLLACAFDAGAICCTLQAALLMTKGQEGPEGDAEGEAEGEAMTLPRGAASWAM